MTVQECRMELHSVIFGGVCGRMSGKIFLSPLVTHSLSSYSPVPKIHSPFIIYCQKVGRGVKKYQVLEIQFINSFSLWGNNSALTRVLCFNYLDFCNFHRQLIVFFENCHVQTKKKNSVKQAVILRCLRLGLIVNIYYDNSGPSPLY